MCGCGGGGAGDIKEQAKLVRQSARQSLRQSLRQWVFGCVWVGGAVEAWGVLSMDLTVTIDFLRREHFVKMRSVPPSIISIRNAPPKHPSTGTNFPSSFSSGFSAYHKVHQIGFQWFRVHFVFNDMKNIHILEYKFSLVFFSPALLDLISACVTVPCILCHPT